MDCGYAVCSTFLPGNKHVSQDRILRLNLITQWPPLCQIIVGTKTGEILIYDIASSTLIETIKAHTATVWSMHIRPDERGLVSGSADKEVKFWDLELKEVTGDDVSLIRARENWNLI